MVYFCMNFIISFITEAHGTANKQVKQRSDWTEYFNYLGKFSILHLVFSLRNSQTRTNSESPLKFQALKWILVKKYLEIGLSKITKEKKDIKFDTTRHPSLPSNASFKTSQTMAWQVPSSRIMNVNRMSCRRDEKKILNLEKWIREFTRTLIRPFENILWNNKRNRNPFYSFFSFTWTHFLLFFILDKKVQR